MSNLLEKGGNVLDATEDAILHQCNCVTKVGMGLSHDLFTKYPFADIYARRQIPNAPGTIDVRQQNGKMIINLFGQYYPGQSRYDGDLAKDRINMFCQALRQIELMLIDTNRIKSLALPYGIGCGLAGGSWSTYHELLKLFAERNPSVQVVLYRL
jgi:O-acetyl-ADP-ribose deacetylase (regulator of RNase III)